MSLGRGSRGGGDDSRGRNRTYLHLSRICPGGNDGGGG